MAAVAASLGAGRPVGPGGGLAGEDGAAAAARSDAQTHEAPQLKPVEPLPWDAVAAAAAAAAGDATKQGGTLPTS